MTERNEELEPVTDVELNRELLAQSIDRLESPGRDGAGRAYYADPREPRNIRSRVEIADLQVGVTITRHDGWLLADALQNLHVGGFTGVAEPEQPTYRVGRHNARNLYRLNEHLGMMFTEAMGHIAARALNLHEVAAPVSPC